MIDAHGHSDLSLPAAPPGFGKISQGITTEISGNCGLSPFPLTDHNRAHLQDLYRRYGIKLDWDDFRSYRARLPQDSLKLVPLCGHNTLRASVAGYDKKELSRGELMEMCRVLERELSAGAAGLSAGLLYTPGCFSDRHEITELLRITSQCGGIFTTHLRSEGNALLEALEETLTAVRESGLQRLHISHFKTAGAANWHKLDAALHLLEEARQDGIRVTMDRYPYCESMTQLSVICRGRFEDLDDSTLETMLRTPGAEQELAELLEDSGRDWRNVRIVSGAFAERTGCTGRSVAEIAAAENISGGALCAALLREDAVGTMAAFRGMSEENCRRILLLDDCCCGTDESVRPENLHFGSSHPRGFGSMPEFFRILRAEGMALETIVWKMTGLPASIFHLSDRGVIAPGKCADLVLWKPEKFRSRASFEAPHRRAEGVCKVWSNGKIIFSENSVIS